MPASPEDLELIAAIATGDQIAFERFDQKYRPWLVAILRKAGVQGEDCYDLAQTCLVDATTGLKNGNFRAESTIKIWLMSIMRHKFWDYKRFERARGRDQTHLFSPVDYTLVSQQTGSQFPHAQDVGLSVRQALLRMPVEPRFILVSNVIWGYTVSELASQLSCSKTRIWEKLSEAKQIFRKLIEGE